MGNKGSTRGKEHDSGGSIDGRTSIMSGNTGGTDRSLGFRDSSLHLDMQDEISPTGSGLDRSPTGSEMEQSTANQHRR